MGTVIDFETGIKTEEPPVECADGHGLDFDKIKTSSHPFPWVTAIKDGNGRCFIRHQTGHASFEDVEITKRQGASMIAVIANWLAR